MRIIRERSEFAFREGVNPTNDREIMGLAGTSTRRSYARSGRHAYTGGRRATYDRVDACMRVHQSRTATRIDEARRPHDGATRNGVATLSSDGARHGETWRGVQCGNARAAGSGREREREQQRLRRVVDDRRHRPGCRPSLQSPRISPSSAAPKEHSPRRARVRAVRALARTRASSTTLAPTPSYRRLSSSRCLCHSFSRLLLRRLPRALPRTPLHRANRPLRREAPPREP